MDAAGDGSELGPSMGPLRLQGGAPVSLLETMQKWEEYQRQCQRNLSEAPPPATGLFCNRSFDGYACWPDGPPGSFVNVSCPWYLPWASSGKHLPPPTFPCIQEAG
ncbi:Glucagon-like peptide 1 receptor [Saguinus oedipus]|uniref:Glucagon-like peptide 1 receptor n=1 Tax=Saguinus oedipus TaxID=9490 RepID=A0ABQ9VWE2_SAGOE|nr:Glucagon-like peptide 1 receptor [Saguinus oedipus]